MLSHSFNQQQQQALRWAPMCSVPVVNCSIQDACSCAMLTGCWKAPLLSQPSWCSDIVFDFVYNSWVKALEPSPSEELLIVARGQHVERWKSPRSSFPEVGVHGQEGSMQCWQHSRWLLRHSSVQWSICVSAGCRLWDENYLQPQLLQLCFLLLHLHLDARSLTIPCMLVIAVPTASCGATPQGKAGYLKWREELKKVHAATVVQLMQQAGYPPESCEKVQRWILKREIKSSAENQVGVGWGWAVHRVGWVGGTATSNRKLAQGGKAVLRRGT